LKETSGFAIVREGNGARDMWSYNRHKDHEMHLGQDEEFPSCYTGPDTVDAWRHNRMLECTVPLLTEWPSSRWITVGDGNFGSDAFFLQNHGVAVTATSISSNTLSIAHANGWINAYAVENAECLSLEDNAVDFVLCKEALHHFPRPPVGFYEMLRVARNAVVLIEPVEAAWRPLSSLKTFAKSVLRGDSDGQFEPSGNFVYRLSVREVFKMLTALGYPCLAWKGINDCYIPRLKTACAKQRSAGWLFTRIGIAAQDALCNVRLLNFGLAEIICFKQEPAMSFLTSLKRRGFTVVNLPRNPYCERSEQTA
jgi:ubiquinone/menaquinone biosynthesis C-methylase UbiE